jgi:hypothetical protein
MFFRARSPDVLHPLVATWIEHILNLVAAPGDA